MLKTNKKIITVLILLAILISWGIKSATTRYDVTDEAIINASPDIVFNAVVNEACGITSWWMPYVSIKPRKEAACGTGDLVDLTVNGEPPVKFTSKTVEIINHKMIKGKYVEGAFRGEYVWTFENVDGFTKLSFHWRTRPAELLLQILAPFLPIEKNHSDTIQAGFKNLNLFLGQKQQR